MGNFKKAMVYLNLLLILALTVAIIYNIWFDRIEFMFWKILGTYATLVISSNIIIRFLPFVDNDRKKK